MFPIREISKKHELLRVIKARESLHCGQALFQGDTDVAEKDECLAKHHTRSLLIEVSLFSPDWQQGFLLIRFQSGVKVKGRVIYGDWE